jgi:hypothetical protein
MASITPSPEPVISVEEARFFESEGLLSPLAGKKRKLSTSLLSDTPPISPSSRSRGSSDRVSSESFEATFTSQEAETSTVPETLESVESLEYVGFTTNMAETIYNRYQNSPKDVPWAFLEFALAVIEDPQIEDAESSQDDWFACMTMIGLDEDFQRAIMLEEFADLRYTATCKFWVRDTMEMRWRFLENLKYLLRERQIQLQKSRARPSLAPRTGSGPRSRKRLSIGGAPTIGQSGPVSSLDSEVQEEPSSAVATVPETPLHQDGHVMLWRAGDIIKHQAFYNEATGRLDLDAISTFPGNFSGNVRLAYFTPQRETADRYATWYKHKAPQSGITIAQIPVPYRFVESLKAKYLWFDQNSEGNPSNEWKNLIWNSRRGNRLPKSLRHLSAEDLLIGHIASGKHCKFMQMESASEIKESDVLTVNIDEVERKSIQWAFQTDEAQDGFEEACRGNVVLHKCGAGFRPKSPP